MWDKRKEISGLTDKSQLILVIGIIFIFNTDQLPLIYNWLKWLLLYQNSSRMTHNVIWITQQGLCVTICYWILFVMIVIKSPRFTGGDFMFLYRFVRHRLKSPRYTRGDFMFLCRRRWRHRPQIFVHAITFENFFGFLSCLAQLLALTYRLPD